MGAMPEEIEPLLAKLDNVKETIYAANKYYEGSYNGQEVVVAYSKIGKVFATLTATILIQKFACDKLLFSGVAGAISDELKLVTLLSQMVYVSMIWILLHLDTLLVMYLRVKCVFLQMLL